MSSFRSSPQWVLACAEWISLELSITNHKHVKYLVNTGADRMLELITRSGDVPVFPFFFGQITGPIGLINLIHWSHVPSPGCCGLQNILNIQLFCFSISHPDCTGSWDRKASFSREMNHHTVTYCAYKAMRRWARPVPYPFPSRNKHLLRQIMWWPKLISLHITDPRVH
jgi:hypothetical protein